MTTRAIDKNLIKPLFEDNKADKPKEDIKTQYGNRIR